VGRGTQRLVAAGRARGPRHPPGVRRLHAGALGVGGLGGPAAVSHAARTGQSWAPAPRDGPARRRQSSIFRSRSRPSCRASGRWG